MFNPFAERMNTIKNQFSIKDLENLTGIKAHTIRIWEKRYNLLQPKRTDTNIRYYDLASFQKLLNVSYLNQNGYKISKIAEIDEKEIPNLVRQIAAEGNLESHTINAFKLAMLNFDQMLFYNTYDAALKEKSFDDVFYDVFIPLLTEIGLLWQTDTITPAHEHFITVLIRQKILINTENIKPKVTNDSTKTFVLYLPEDEIHELGIMFVNYQLIKKGYQSIFLGFSVPKDSLLDLQKYYKDITYVSYFTVKPEKDNINDYLNDFHNKLLDNGSNSKLWILGHLLNSMDLDNLPQGVTPFKKIGDLVDKL